MMIITNKKIASFLLLCTTLFSTIGYTQNSLNLIEVDKVSLDLYNSQQWNELIEFGEKALSENIEFYYLDYRMGIAYYSVKKYRKAAPLFENVVETTPNDAIAKEYLYYSYLFGGRIGDATSTMYTLEKSHRKKIEFHNSNSLFNGLGFEYKYYSFGDYTIDENVNKNNKIEQKVRNSMSYLSADLMNYSTKNSTYTFNLSSINGRNSVYNDEYSTEVIDERLKQLQFYTKWNNHLAKGLYLTLSLTYMRETIDWYYNNRNRPSTYAGNFVTNNFVGFLSLTKDVNNFSFGLGSSFSRINEVKQVQPFAEIKWYPFSNTNFYSTSTISYQYNINNNNDNFIFKQSFNANVTTKFSISAFGLYGTVYNFVDNEGLSIYNNLDAIDYWYGISANYYFNSLVQMYISYRNDGQTNDYIDAGLEKNISYNINSVLIGLRFNF